MPFVDASFLGSSDGVPSSKCIRVAEHNTRKMLIGELLNRTRLEKLLRDSYGNYCVQVHSFHDTPYSPRAGRADRGYCIVDCTRLR